MLAAENFLQNLEANYGFATNNTWAVLNDTDYLYVLYNGRRALAVAYDETLDGLMQSAIQDSMKVNDVQLVVLGVEGGLVGLVAFAMVWLASSKVVAQRYSVFEVFLKLPHGVIKSQASQVVTLVEGEGDNEAAEAEADEADVSHGGGLDMEKGAASVGPVKAVMATKINTAGPQDSATGPQPQAWWRRLFHFSTRPTTDQPGSRRQLQTSSTAVLKLTWPFLFWAVFVITINVVGYYQLKSISSPIAMSNVVQFVCVRANQVLLSALRLVSDNQLDPLYGYTTTNNTAWSGDLTRHNQLLDLQRAALQQDLDLLLQEYDAMLYGSASATVANLTAPDPHFELAKQGIMFTPGADHLFSYQGCMCEDNDDCLPETAPFYKYVAAGLDALLTHYFHELEALLLLPNNQTNLDAAPFKYIFEIGNSDLHGGLEQLIDVYSEHLVASSREAITLHIIAFVVAVLTGFSFVVFIQRPAFTNATSEAKRIAELLAQLPAELDVEGMVGDALRACHVLDPATAGTGGMSALARQQSSASEAFL